MASELTAAVLAELKRIRSDLNDRFNPDEVSDHQCCFCGECYTTTSSRGDMEDAGYCWACATEKMEVIGPHLPALIAAAERADAAEKRVRELEDDLEICMEVLDKLAYPTTITQVLLSNICEAGQNELHARAELADRERQRTLAWKTAEAEVDANIARTALGKELRT